MQRAIQNGHLDVVGCLMKTEGQQMTAEMLRRVIEGQNITTAIPQATEGRNTTIEVPQVTDRDCVQEILKAIPDISPESKAKLSEILNRLFEEVKK